MGVDLSWTVRTQVTSLLDLVVTWCCVPAHDLRFRRLLSFLVIPGMIRGR